MVFRALFAIAAFYNLDIEQMDIKTAFLYGIIDQLLYVEVPKGYEQQWKNQVCLLKKVLYGLKQSPQLWYKRLANFLFTKLGLHRLHADHSIFATDQDIKNSIITSFIDNLNIFALLGSGIISCIKSELTTAFEMVNMGPLVFYVGLKVTRDQEKRTIKLSQPGYIEKLLDCHGMLKAKTAKVFIRDTILLPSNTPASELEKV